MAPTGKHGDQPKSRDAAAGASEDGAKSDRQARLEAALRANLKKRKRQARGRKSVDAPPDETRDGPEKA